MWLLSGKRDRGVGKGSTRWYTKSNARLCCVLAKQLRRSRQKKHTGGQRSRGAGEQGRVKIQNTRFVSQKKTRRNRVLRWLDGSQRQHGQFTRTFQVQIRELRLLRTIGEQAEAHRWARNGSSVELLCASCVQSSIFAFSQTSTRYLY